MARFVVAQNTELGEMIGWDDMAHQVAGVVHSLPVGEQASVTIYTSNYSEAGAIEYWRSELGVPQPISEQNNYWIWGFGPAHEDGTTVTVGFTREQMSAFFSDCRDAGTVTNSAGVHNDEFGSPILVCRDQQVPWSIIWEKMRDFS
jgi:hypothetical protein